MSEQPPSIFGHKRPNLMKIYEILKSAEDPLPRTSLFLKAHANIQRDISILSWLHEQGLIEWLDDKERDKAFRASSRKANRTVKGYFMITERGRAILNVYEGLFDVLGFTDQIKERFPPEEIGVRTRPFSGQKIRL